MTEPRKSYERVLLKLSGEVFGGAKGVGVDPDVVIFGAGAGMPFFTTDTVAAQRALEIGADALLLAKSGVDGVYSADPRKDKNATKFDFISYNDVLSKSLAVADAAAFSLCRENKLPIVVFNLMENGNIARAVRGESIGTLVN